jgi:GNAT superfamily N-acetyltransferase
MPIAYSDIQDFDRAQLQDLFLSVGWSSGQYPDELVKAMLGSDRVVSAWDGDRLVGLINAISDGAMTAYFHWVLVRPEYQRRGIGRALVTSMLAHYRQYLRKVLVAYDSQVGFYEACGFVAGAASTPMFVTDLTT